MRKVVDVENDDSISSKYNSFDNRRGCSSRDIVPREGFAGVADKQSPEPDYYHVVYPKRFNGSICGDVGNPRWHYPGSNRCHF